MNVAVCVITYQRPGGLARLLDGLTRLTFEGDAPDLRCIIVDNDEEGTAGAVCDEIQPNFRWPLEYHVEPRRGIPFARNKAVAVAKHTADFIAFIDDDEVPEPNWLDELIRVQREHNADVVTGPVLPRFVEKPPSWIVAGKFFERKRYPTGCPRDRAFTGNVLFRSDILDKLDPIFDERMAMTGCDDVHFFRRVHRAGFQIVWADEARVCEWQPRTRTTVRWLVQRSFRTGSSSVWVERDLAPSFSTSALFFVKGVAWVVIGLSKMPCGLILGRHVTVKGLQGLAYGVGELAGVVGLRYQEYRKTHGS